MARRDVVKFPAPIQREPSYLGCVLEPDVRVDLATRRVTGHVRFYDASGKFLRSEPFEARIGGNRRDNLATDILADIQAQRPELAGPVTSEEVPSVDDPVSG